jgi:hypothetical protein
VTVLALTAERVTLKAKVVVPELPSLAVTLAIATVGSASSLVIVPVPTPVPETVALVGFESATVKVSLGSIVVSPTTATTTCFAVWPGAKVRVPVAAA